MRPSARVLVVAAGLLGPAAVIAADPMLDPAAAASCAVVRISATPNSLVQLTVSSVSVTKGGCVAFSNATSGSVRVTVVGTTYSQSVPAKGTTSGSSNYVVTKTVTVQAAGGLRSGSGTITATAASPTPSHSPTPTPTRTPSARTSPTTSPSPAASHHRRHHRHRHRVKVSLPPLPPLPTGGLSALPPGSNPVVAPGLTSASAAPSQPTSGAPTTAVATAVDPASNNDRGLPALIAAVLVIGLAAAYGRAVLGYVAAVDNGPSRGHRA